MKAVGIKLLKNNLSRYLDLVRKGETIFVTDRDEVIAEIHQPINASAKVSRWELFLNEQERKGALRRAVRSTSKLREILGRRTVKTPKGGPSSKELLDSIRTDRFE